MRLRGLGMGLSKIRIGDVISLVDERNSFGITDFYGINIFKEFMPTVANTENLDNTKYKIVRKNRFVYSGMQTGRDKCIRISMFMKDSPVIVSPAYTTFEVDQEKILPEYFFMLFLSKEKDRLGWFHSDGSVRANLDWDVFCDLEFEIPDVPTQQKYVDIYDAMCANQKAYEKGLDDLKLTCDAYIDSAKKRNTSIPLGQIFEEINLRNSANQIKNVLGIDINKRFMKTKASINVEDLANYKVINKNQFAFSGMQTGRDKTVRIALYSNEECAVISPAYTVYKVSNESFLPDFLMIWFERLEFDRKGWFYSDGSVRANLDNDRFFEMTVPQIPLKEQQAIVEVYCSYLKRKNIAEKFAHSVKNICPILIKGAIEEGKSKRG